MYKQVSWDVAESLSESGVKVEYTRDGYSQWWGIDITSVRHVVALTSTFGPPVFRVEVE